jgi:hypothetical protein
MLLPLVALLLQDAAAPPPPDAKPVRVWLATAGPLLRGQPVQVYVSTAADGYLVVLHRRTDGRIEVLFPGNPGDDPYTRSGTYEIRNAADREAFVVAEPDGTGLILAALSPASYRFDEFVRAAVWNPDALVPSWSGADEEGALADIVQRMLGDGYFNYDVVAYAVAPRGYALQDTTAPYATYPSCTDCSFVGFQEIIAGPIVEPLPSSGSALNVMAVPAAAFGPRAVLPRTTQTTARPMAPRRRSPHVAVLGPRRTTSPAGAPTARAVPVRRRAPVAAAPVPVRLMPSPTAASEPPRPAAPEPRARTTLVAAAPAAPPTSAAPVGVRPGVVAVARPIAVAGLAPAAPQSGRSAMQTGRPQAAMALPGNAWHVVVTHSTVVAVPARPRH